MLFSIRQTLLIAGVCVVIAGWVAHNYVDNKGMDAEKWSLYILIS